VKLGSYLQHMYQFGYVTRDMEAAKRRITETMGVETFHERESKRTVELFGRPSPFRIQVALANIGDKQIEIILPLEGVVGFYYDGLNLDRGPLALHHIGIMVADPDEAWEPMRKAVREAGYVAALESDDPTFVRILYADTRADLGHYVEFLGFSAEALALHRNMPNQAR
jgi:hypothetical protein